MPEKTSLILVLTFMLLFMTAAASANRCAPPALVERDVRTYLEISADIARLSVDAPFRPVGDDDGGDFLDQRDELLRSHGWSPEQFEYMKERISHATVMLYRYRVLLDRRVQRARQAAVILGNPLFTNAQKERMLRTIRETYAVEMERIETTRQDWAAVAPHVEALERTGSLTTVHGPSLRPDRHSG